MFDDRTTMTREERDEMAEAKLAEFGYTQCEKCKCRFLSLRDNKLCVDCRRILELSPGQRLKDGLAPALVSVILTGVPPGNGSTICGSRIGSPATSSTVSGSTTTSPYCSVTVDTDTSMNVSPSMKSGLQSVTPATAHTRRKRGRPMKLGKKLMHESAIASLSTK